jgi:dTDP-4-dehydrorhamnose 3,5-epimerase-like enzyme
MNIDSVSLIDFPVIEDSRGNLSFAEGNKHIPFEIRRAYWIYDVPGGQKRGGHAFKEQKEVIIALSGSFDVVINDTSREKKFHLNRSYYGLYVPNGLWRAMENFATNTVALVISSTLYDEEDYIRNFSTYKNWHHAHK